MADQYRTSFPTALPGGRGRPAATPVGVALPGMTKAKKLRKSRTKKRTGYAYEPVGKKLPKKKSKKARALFADVRARHSTSATKAAALEMKRALAREAKATAAAAGKVKASKASTLAKKAGDKAVAVVAGAVGRALFPGGRTGAKRRAETAGRIVKAVRGALGTTAGKAVGVGAAGIAAYAITRKSKLGGRAGDAVVAAYYRRKDRSESARMQAFRNALAAERSQGPVSSARVKELAATFGFSTTGK